MVEESAEKKLYDAAAVGNVATFQKVLQENPHFVDVVSFPCLRNVLHIAIRHGRESLVEEVLRINPDLAQDLDSKNSSSLHIAAAKGKVQIVKKLLAVAPEMCWWRDSHDMNPVHIAAVKGHEDVLEKLLEHDSLPAMERVYRGQTVLHLCMKHRQLETLKFLAKKLGDLLCAKDDDGETILHLAVRSNQVEMIPYLMKSGRIDKLTTNSTGKTALDIFKECPDLRRPNYARIRKSLEYLPMPEFLSAWSDTTMVVMVLIAAMAFQATISPPGGVWQDDTSSHSVGKAVMASINPMLYIQFSRANTTAFASSLITIFLIATARVLSPIGGSWPHNFLTVMAWCAIWASLTSIGVSYGDSLILTDPHGTLSIVQISVVVVSVFISFLGVAAIFSLATKLGTQRLRKQWQQEDRFDHGSGRSGSP